MGRFHATNVRERDGAVLEGASYPQSYSGTRNTLMMRVPVSFEDGRIKKFVIDNLSRLGVKTGPGVRDNGAASAPFFRGRGTEHIFFFFLRCALHASTKTPKYIQIEK